MTPAESFVEDENSESHSISSFNETTQLTEEVKSPQLTEQVAKTKVSKKKEA